MSETEMSNFEVKSNLLIKRAFKIDVSFEIILLTKITIE